MNFIKKVMIYLLIVSLAFMCMPPCSVSAVTESEYSTISDAEKEANGNIQGRLEGNISEEFYGEMPKARIAGYSHNSKFDGWDIQEGIDVSKFQGNIDWNKVKADGIDFAFIRIAGRGYGSSGVLYYDETGLTNLKNAKAAGLDVGVYMFSQAITQAEAREEAKYILNRISGYEIDLPVVFDYEYVAGGRLSNAKLTDAQRTSICKAFCEVVKSYGYNAMVYANASMLSNDLTATSLASSYDIWLAHYTAATNYKGTYNYWQYTEKGRVAGINGNVDRNYRYVEPGLRIVKRTTSSVKMEWTPVEGAAGYHVYRKGADGVYKHIKSIAGYENTEYTNSGLRDNASIGYKIRYYKLNSKGEKVEYLCGYKYQSPTIKTVLKLPVLQLTGKAIDAGTVKLTWPKETDGDGYIIQQYNNSKGKYETIKTVTDKNTSSYYKYGLKLGTTYKFRVRSYAKVAGVTRYSSYSEPVSVKTATTLKQPTLTAKTYSYTSINLTWKKIQGAAGYQIQRYSSSKGKYVTIKTITSGSTLKYKDTYLNAGTKYHYRIRAYATLSGKKVYSKYSTVKYATTSKSRIGKVTASKVNVRAGAGTSYKKLTTVSKGKELTITGSTKNWYKIKIKVNGKYKTGYIYKSYVILK